MVTFNRGSNVWPRLSDRLVSFLEPTGFIMNARFGLSGQRRPLTLRETEGRSFEALLLVTQQSQKEKSRFRATWHRRDIYKT